MKIKPEHYEVIEQGFIALSLSHNLYHYKANLRADPRVRDVDKRLRWDMFYALPSEIRYPLLDAVYQYADDTHLDTALRKALAATLHNGGDI